MSFADSGTWRLIFDVMMTIGMVALWLRRPGEDASSAVASLKADTSQSVTDLRGRIDVLSERVRHMPSSEELASLRGEMHGIRERLGGLEDTAKTTRSTVQRIEDFLREKG